MAADSRNAGEDSDDAGSLVTMSFRLPRWLYDELGQIASRRISDRSTMIREALLMWLADQRKDAA